MAKRDLRPRDSASGWVRAVVPSVVATAVAWVILALVLAPAFSPSGAPFPVQVTDETRVLGPVFHPGVILSGDSNTTTTLLGGIGANSRIPGATIPVLASLTPGAAGPNVTNETSQVARYFLGGGVYAIGWNGSAWLIGGQRSPGGLDQGALISVRGGTITDLTGTVASYFSNGGGIWSLGWNGTSWLLGGNHSTTVTLLSWSGGPITDLSAHLTAHGPLPWIQMLRWNGAEWLIGGHGIFGLWTSTGYVDLLPASPFQGGGAYSADWNGTAWLVGGGGPILVFVRGTGETDATTLPAAFDQVVLMILSVQNEWYIAGKGAGPGGSFVPELVLWGGSASVPIQDLSGSVPTSFAGGEIQGGIPAPELGTGAFLLVGEGAYDPGIDDGWGALALLETSGR